MLYIIRINLTLKVCLPIFVYNGATIYTLWRIFSRRRLFMVLPYIQNLPYILHSIRKY